MTAALTTRITKIGHLSSKKNQKRRQVIIAFLIILVAVMFFIDGYLLCRYLERQEQVVECREPGQCSVPEPMIAENGKSNNRPAGQATKEPPMSESVYSHDVLGLAISYPDNWQGVTIAEEYSETVDGVQDIVALKLFPDLGGGTDVTSFLYAINPHVDVVESHQLDWGDGKIATQDNVRTWCEDQNNCFASVNRHGLIVARVIVPEQGTDAELPVPGYYIYNPIGDYNLIAIPAESAGGVAVTEERLRKIAGSARPLPRN